MKINLKVQAEFDIDGSIRPTSIVWEDGRVFAIDRILDIRRAASLKAVGMGMRYTCRICGKVVNLFNDENHRFCLTMRTIGSWRRECFGKCTYRNGSKSCF